MNALVVLNSRAGSLTGVRAHEFDFATLRNLLAQRGFTAEWREPAPREDLAATLRAAVEQRPDAVIVGGGDGTISAAAGFLAGTGIALGVLPLGTLNHFARDLGLPQDWRDAAARFSTTGSTQVDVAEVNGRVFINNCSLGSYAEAVRRRDALRRRQGHRKTLAMVMASWTVFRDLRRMRAAIKLPGRTLQLRSPLILVGNNRYTGHLLNTSLRPRLDAGELCLYVTRTAKRRALLHLAWQALVHRIDSADELEIHSAAEMTIEISNGRAPIAADGELLALRPPFHFRIRPRALSVLGIEVADRK